MTSFVNSLTFVFKEKNRGAKIGFFALFLLVSLVGSAVSLWGASEFLNVNGNSDFWMQLYEEEYLNSYEFTGFGNPLPFIIAMVISFAASIIYLFGTLWYAYENAESAIWNTESETFGSMPFGKSVRRVLKLFGAYFFYLLFILAIFALFACISLVLTTVTFGLFICCLFILILPILAMFLAIHYLMFIPGVARMIKENRFGAVFELGANWSFGKRNWQTFAQIFLLDLAVFVIYAIVSMFSNIFYIFDSFNAILILSFIWSSIVSIFYGYYSFYVRPNWAGKVARQAFINEGEIK